MFLDDHMNDPKFALTKDKGCMRSWKGNFNCTNYGLPYWVLTQSIRDNNKKGFEWLADHVRHMINYGYDCGNGPDPHFYHKSGGEGVIGHAVYNRDPKRPGKSLNWDSDISRHVHLAPYCALYYAQQIKLTVTERARLLDMIIDWASQWYMMSNHMISREKGSYFMYGRSLIPALGLIHTYYITQDRRYFMAAESLFAHTFLGFGRKLPNGFISFDSGYEGEGRTQKLLYHGADNAMSGWQIGFLGQVAYEIYCHTKNVTVRQLCLDTIMYITDWIVRNDVPMGDLNEGDDGLLRLSFLQGGSLTGVYNNQMTPKHALNIDSNTSFYPLTVLRSHLYDGKYFATLLPNNKPRLHYPRSPLGPACSLPLLYNWADLLVCRYLITQKKNDLDWARWVYRDSKYFANRSSNSDKRTLNDRDVIHYGTCLLYTSPSPRD